ncbi:hypothetical protein ABVT39_006309 [Epinephelus coioides]
MALWDGREPDSVGHSCVDTDDAVRRRPEEDHCVRLKSPQEINQRRVAFRRTNEQTGGRQAEDKWKTN